MFFFLIHNTYTGNLDLHKFGRRDMLIYELFKISTLNKRLDTRGNKQWNVLNGTVQIALVLSHRYYY